MSKGTLLIIDDEPQIRRLLSINFQNQEYKVIEAATADEGLRLAASHLPDLILLDLGLPDLSGHELLKQLREWYTKPILILTVENKEEDIVVALDNGANDYLCKPFRVGELLARVRSALRMNTTESSSIIQLGALEVDLVGQTTRLDGEILKLTSTEFTLLALLAKHAGRVLTHQFLLKEVWGVGYQTETQYLRVFVAQLRKKIEKDPNHPLRLVTVSGVGYRLESL
ncbi:two component transcriptional regulator, winged helix family [Leadbetterella byssophila DSM 17132]|uniref:Two component transcriptional regulator, winged helix family n=1 Tax=Leadbetterella byssophila (strain DSM 17132 / JCM 16389 / KACC 11308 / NBRC 106382 / 4M15) TaxID=649349 RepID=E4RUD9_LEAB4|nr:response regulator transcription factor [Leadbetterella byssophila]ADQ17830.1 two component transcriptional regulator, winged helix family [Leadbetterella byssophila DSM 17132]